VLAINDYDHVSAFGAAALPARGRHAWTVAFAGAAGGDLGGVATNARAAGVLNYVSHEAGLAFAGVVARKTGRQSWAISTEAGAYGLSDRGDNCALRADGKMKGAVRRNAHGRAFSRGDSVTCVADMDARPRTLALYRNAEPEPLGTVAGFGAEAYVCATYDPNFGPCDELVLSFGKEAAEAKRLRAEAVAEEAAAEAARLRAEEEAEKRRQQEEEAAAEAARVGAAHPRFSSLAPRVSSRLTRNTGDAAVTSSRPSLPPA
jgi:hypothetical protein